jgi:adenylate cyclase class 2
MAVEIELKAHIDDPLGVKARLSALGNYLTAYEKDDTYWFSQGPSGLPPPGLRVRRESSDGSERVLVTWKTREMNGGIEINDEREFSVSNAESFTDLISLMGLLPAVRKHKQGWAFNCMEDETMIRAELSDVRGLGWFLELEIIAEESGRETAALSGKRLLSLLEKLGISSDRIESRPYTGMLAEKGIAMS